MSDSLRPHGLYSPWTSPGQNNGVGSLPLLQGIFLTQESNWGLLHCRRILYQLNYQRSPETRMWDTFNLSSLFSSPFLMSSSAPHPSLEPHKSYLNYRNNVACYLPAYLLPSSNYIIHSLVENTP